MFRIKRIVSLLIVTLALFAMISNVDLVGAEDTKETITIPSNTTIRVSVASDGTQGNGNSYLSNYLSTVSGNGRYVVFSSNSTNLVSDDTNGKWSDIFLHDTLTQDTILVSVASDGTQGNSGGSSPSISSNGRYVAFSSYSNNLVSGDTNYETDVFLHDMQTGVTSRVSVASDGTEAICTGPCEGSEDPSLSADGRFVAFYSDTSNLVNGDTNGKGDVFLHDSQTHVTSIISVASDGTLGNGLSGGASISSDGRYVAFLSHATNLVSGDTNLTPDVFLHDTVTGDTTLISVASNGTQGNSGSGFNSISADGRYIAYVSYATNLISGDTNGYADIFLHDTQTGETIRISESSNGIEGNYHSKYPSISADGRYVVFPSEASNLVTGDTNGFGDIFLHDTETGITSLVSIASDGTQGNDNTERHDFSADGRYVVFSSDASNFVSGDTNGTSDVFLRKLMQFGDVPSSYWAFLWIDSIYNAGITSGYPDGTYRPANPVTRAEMAVFLLGGMGVSAPPKDGSHPFSDISGHWAEKYIEELYDQGITGGYPDGTYRPENQVTRAEMAIFLLKGIGVSPPPLDGSHPFSDISGHWAEIFIEELYDQGITGGYPDGTYRPESKVTRAEMAVFLVKTFSLPLP